MDWGLDSLRNLSYLTHQMRAWIWINAGQTFASRFLTLFSPPYAYPFIGLFFCFVFFCALCVADFSLTTIQQINSYNSKYVHDSPCLTWLLTSEPNHHLEQGKMFSRCLQNEVSWINIMHIIAIQQISDKNIVDYVWEQSLYSKNWDLNNCNRQRLDMSTTNTFALT